MVTIVVLQFSIVSAVGKQYMSAVDWRSEEDYANFEKAEAADIAWEWLRRDGDYHKDYEALAIPARLNGATGDFRHKWGLSFRS
jgi:heme-degrading monooxygenase HmoA